MEKLTAHTRLAVVHAMVAAGKMKYTAGAVSGAAQLGMTVGDIQRVVAGLKTKNFIKSMTTYTNHQIWQDVYRPVFEGRTLYVKLTVADDVLVVSFKER